MSNLDIIRQLQTYIPEGKAYVEVDFTEVCMSLTTMLYKTLTDYLETDFLPPMFTLLNTPCLKLVIFRVTEEEISNHTYTLPNSFQGYDKQAYYIPALACAILDEKKVLKQYTNKTAHILYNLLQKQPLLYANYQPKEDIITLLFNANGNDKEIDSLLVHHQSYYKNYTMKRLNTFMLLNNVNAINLLEVTYTGKKV